MSFTDDDLKRLKVVADASATIHDRPFYCLGTRIQSLLARLEAAEAYCNAVEMGYEYRDCDYPNCGKNWICSDCVNEIDARKVWRKAAGK